MCSDKMRENMKMVRFYQLLHKLKFNMKKICELMLISAQKNHKKSFSQLTVNMSIKSSLVKMKRRKREIKCFNNQ